MAKNPARQHIEKNIADAIQAAKGQGNSLNVSNIDPEGVRAVAKALQVFPNITSVLQERLG